MRMSFDEGPGQQADNPPGLLGRLEVVDARANDDEHPAFEDFVAARSPALLRSAWMLTGGRPAQ